MHWQRRLASPLCRWHRWRCPSLSMATPDPSHATRRRLRNENCVPCQAHAKVIAFGDQVDFIVRPTCPKRIQQEAQRDDILILLCTCADVSGKSKRLRSKPSTGGPGWLPLAGTPTQTHTETGLWLVAKLYLKYAAEHSETEQRSKQKHAREKLPQRASCTHTRGTEPACMPCFHSQNKPLCWNGIFFRLLPEAPER